MGTHRPVLVPGLGLRHAGRNRSTCQAFPTQRLLGVLVVAILVLPTASPMTYSLLHTNHRNSFAASCAWDPAYSAQSEYCAVGTMLGPIGINAGHTRVGTLSVARLPSFVGVSRGERSS